MWLTEERARVEPDSHSTTETARARRASRVASVRRSNPSGLGRRGDGGARPRPAARSTEWDASPARIAARNRKKQRGMTLVEIMVVMVIIAMIAGGVGVAVFPAIEKARKRQTHIDAVAIAGAVERYRLTRPRACPTVDELREDGEIRQSESGLDQWDQPFTISCDRGEVTVTSPGSDGNAGTEDDITNLRDPSSEG